MKDTPAIQRPFTTEDLRPLLAEADVDATVLVQTWSSIAETWDFLELAGKTDFIAGVVGWVDLSYPFIDSILAELLASPHGHYLVGIRHQVHDEPDPNWLLRPDVQHGLQAVQNAGLVYDLLTRTRELPACLETVCQFPQLRFVIDHIAKPPIASGATEDWFAKLEPFGQLENVWCKLSGMVTEADWDLWTPADLAPYVNRVIEIFGEDRLIFGSDWPVCLSAATYEEVKNALEDALGDTHDTAWAKIFGANAIDVYRLDL